jgi:carbon monoxide dehydrogenase subunit G
MRQSGEYRIAAPADTVWLALNDPEVLAQCIDGCQSMTRTGDDAFAAVVKARIGPLSATFSADVKLTDLDPPRAYTLEANVKGGAAGFAKGTARVSLSEEGGETVLRYEVEGSVGGKLAQVGQRLIDAAARKTADDFFTKFREVVAPATAATPETASRAKVLAPLLVALAAIAGLFAFFGRRRRAGRTQTETTA